jgi:hypothetical protein
VCFDYCQRIFDSNVSQNGRCSFDSVYIIPLCESGLREIRKSSVAAECVSLLKNIKFAREIQKLRRKFTLAIGNC